MTDPRVIEAAKALYERRIPLMFNVPQAGDSYHPRLGMRTMAWDELPNTAKEIEIQSAQAALLSFLRAEPTEGMIKAVNDKERSVGITTAAKMGHPTLRLHYSTAYEAMTSQAAREIEGE